MTSWGVAILVAAMFLGLKDSLEEKKRYVAVCVVVVVALLYAAFRQHTY